MNIIHTTQAAPPAGHYAQAVTSGDLVFVSGILPVGIDGTINLADPFHTQAERVLSYASAILKEIGADFSHVLKVTVYVADIDNWPVFNELYAAAFGSHTPARTVVPVPELHHGYGIEIDLIASKFGIAAT